MVAPSNPRKRLLTTFVSLATLTLLGVASHALASDYRNDPEALPHRCFVFVDAGHWQYVGPPSRVGSSVEFEDGAVFVAGGGPVLYQFILGNGTISAAATYNRDHGTGAYYDQSTMTTLLGDPGDVDARQASVEVASDRVEDELPGQPDGLWLCLLEFNE